MNTKAKGYLLGAVAAATYGMNPLFALPLYKEGMELLVVPSAELSRGRGGPRCMSMPFWREDL